MVFWSVFLGHISVGFIGFNKPPIEDDQLPVETHSFHYTQYKSHYNQ